MDWINALGMIAGSLTTIAFLPQLLKTWQSRSARDISFSWLITFSAGITLWLIYGICLGALPIILANAVTLVLTSLILFFKIRYR